MKQLTLLLAAIALVTGVAGPARADMFNFSFADSKNGITASGTLVATDNGGGQFTVTSVINGIITGNPGGDGALTLIANPNAPGGSAPFGDFTYDDFLFPGEFPYIDSDGLLFSVPNGSVVNIYNIFGPGVPEPEPGYQLADGDSAGNGGFTGALTPNFTLTPAVATPEPSSLCLLGLGAAGLAAYRKRKRS
jgi:hypothetical protein